MTSGVFHLVALDDIVVDRERRQRQDLLKNIDQLAESIGRLGLINPITITRKMELVAGERRYTACKQLGWDRIPAQYVDELDADRLYAIELEENIKRQDISWQDQTRAILEYHKLRAAGNSEWRQQDTANALGLHQTLVSKMISVAEELAAGNKMVQDAPQLSTAIGIAFRARERRDEAIIHGLHETFGGIKLSAPPPSQGVLNVDFTEWVLGDIATRFNLIHCDFPYGIEADTFNQGAAPSFGGYEDTPETWDKLMYALEIATRTITAPSCHLMFWYAMRKGDDRLYEPTARRLEAIGWRINPMPLIWMKSDGVGIIPDPERGPRQIYETCLFGSKGDRKIVRAKSNAYACPTDSKFHMSTKPEPMLRHFFEMLVDENTILLDPTCGSGSALRAAESLGAKYVLGLERDSGFAGEAQKALDGARRLRRVESKVNEPYV